MDKGTYYIQNIDFAKKMVDDYMETSTYFKKRNLEQQYEHCFQNAKNWMGIYQQWIDLARAEKCYIVD